jgi:hypothetical protein
MNAGLIVGLVLCQVGIYFSLFMIMRNERVAAYRHQLLEELSMATKATIHNGTAGENFLWRYREFERVPYGAMVYIFWRPFSWFWPNRALLVDPKITEEEYRNVRR